MCHVTKYSTIRGVFQQPWPGVSPTAVLNEEKALGTRLQTNFTNIDKNYNTTKPYRHLPGNHPFISEILTIYLKSRLVKNGQKSTKLRNYTVRNC